MSPHEAQQRAERLVNRVMPDVIVATSVHDPSRSSTVDVSGWKKDFKKVITAELLAVQRETEPPVAKGSDASGGWKVATKYLEKVREHMENETGEYVHWEVIEAVLLAAQAIRGEVP